MRGGGSSDLPAIETAADVANALGAIAGAMAAGELTPDEAGAVAGVIEAKRRAIETVEHEERLRKLERKVSWWGRVLKPGCGASKEQVQPCGLTNSWWLRS
jgi:hypothetical protein